MVSMLASSVVDNGFETCQIKPNTYKVWYMLLLH